MEPAAIEPDAKDWTVVIDEGCAECGFAPPADLADVGARIRATVPVSGAALAPPDPRRRPPPQTW